jgi:hypothetical protein
MFSNASQFYNSAFSKGFSPNVVDEWYIILRVREVPDSNLGPETGYPD